MGRLNLASTDNGETIRLNIHSTTDFRKKCINVIKTLMHKNTTYSLSIRKHRKLNHPEVFHGCDPEPMRHQLHNPHC